MGSKKNGTNKIKCKTYKDNQTASKNKVLNIERDRKLKAKHAAKKSRRK